MLFCEGNIYVGRLLEKVSDLEIVHCPNWLWKEHLKIILVWVPCICFLVYPLILVMHNPANVNINNIMSLLLRHSEKKTSQQGLEKL